MSRFTGSEVGLGMAVALAALALSGQALAERRLWDLPDKACLVAGIRLAQLTGEMARVEADLRALDPDEECDLVCSANERHRSVLLSFIRDEYKVLREHRCRELARETE